MRNSLETRRKVSDDTGKRKCWIHTSVVGLQPQEGGAWAHCKHYRWMTMLQQ